MVNHRIKIIKIKYFFQNLPWFKSTSPSALVYVYLKVKLGFPFGLKKKFYVNRTSMSTKIQILHSLTYAFAEHMKEIPWYRNVSIIHVSFWSPVKRSEKNIFWYFQGNGKGAIERNCLINNEALYYVYCMACNRGTHGLNWTQYEHSIIYLTTITQYVIFTAIQVL